MKKMPTLDAVVFDLDDTLYLERDYVISGFHAVAAWAERELNLPFDESLADLRSLFDEGAHRNTFDVWLRAHDLAPETHVRTMVGVYREHDPAISTFEVVPGLLARLAETCRVGLITDGRSPVQRRKMTALGLRSSFDAVVLTGDFGRDWWKPSVRPFELIIGLLEARAHNAVYVADNPTKDFIGARAAGMSTIRIRTSLGLYSSLPAPTPAHAPDMDIKELSALDGALAEAGFPLRRPH
jgi:putative hydrolase of the HAD superfamily